jgi:putative tryptophan/tyrosine transport system ATP-binding protein
MIAAGLHIRDLTKSFRNGDEQLVALEMLDLHVPRGQFVSIVGPNGSGKSTLINLVAGDFPPDAGLIDWVEKDDQLERRFRPRPGISSQKIGRVYQDPKVGTVPELTVEEHFRLAFCEGVPSPFRRGIRREDASRCSALLEQVGLQRRAGAQVRELSGGQRQMLALALATARRPAILLLDEHTSALDPSNAAVCMSATERIWRAYGVTVLMATHELGDAVRCGDRLLVFRAGRIVADYMRMEKQSLNPAELLRHWTPS